ncbi:Actin-like protein arp5 like [Verticillium longisporum]|uniref:Actin-like protein arp5 like n=1 Tax=Verticillium longisporum TaxID=100787 RepID=A0A8I3AH82_VERLO|nr:Actin-like protein arp5 like [Verticillium longisporum]
MLAQATRLNSGGWHSAEYLLKLLRLKYPAFVGKLSPSQAERMVRDHCYLSADYDNELSGYLDWTGLEDRDVVIQYPYTEEAEANQIHLNVERIRVPEVVFRPSIAGVDQAGLVEITGDILTHRLVDQVGGSDAFLKDVFLTGGNTLFKNFDQRLRDGLAALLPAGAPLRTRRAADPLLDAWRGAAEWSGGDAWKAAAVTKAEYEEKGHEYLKEHDLGNSCPPV